MSYKQYYQHFLKQHPETLHCSPHSHHYWPDVTRAAQLAYWDDSAKGVDHKWDMIFGERLPRVQKLLAELLDHPAPEQFVFASNTHELLYRVISCFDPAQPLRILTSDGEFHSFSRQVRRLEERANVEVVRVSCEPYATFAERWQQALQQQSFDLIFCSQVFFNSGVVAPWVGTWLAWVPESTQVVIDGYHGCGALPTSLHDVADRIFYVAGAYKYLQAGEGCCFMSVPKGTALRPEYTGWFADFANLAKPQQATVEYANDGMRFAGATMDFTALYRLEAVVQWWREDGITVAAIHQYVQRLQADFLAVIDELEHPLLNRAALLVDDLAEHGHFLTFELPSAAEVATLAQQLQQGGVETDYRGKRLRFGFALYHDASDYQRLKKALS
ncbi:aminotransferase class V-fold PLP-dependent enzyme [Pseudidiomarina homiensis]|uniref:Selenocysteine lyase n=1 Tax=Pseudidiomarina homiensis TaxID=364198 RepID=A0A432Y659_9GAMM|nr:aminotransferase class V-fold PLP-dependent enzyme [Pseudidiomarina homiensis]RUO56485.1 selenocysteine lyase [Pseudidiomarina homiensis]